MPPAPETGRAAAGLLLRRVRAPATGRADHLSLQADFWFTAAIAI